MTWEELKQAVQDYIHSRELSEPRLRLSALDNIDALLARLLPEVKQDPKQLLKYEKQTVESLLSKGKPNGKLNGAEKSVLNTLYRFVSERA